MIRQRAQSVADYAVTCALIGVVSVSTVGFFLGPTLAAGFQDINTELASVFGGQVTDLDDEDGEEGGVLGDSGSGPSDSDPSDDPGDPGSGITDDPSADPSASPTPDPTPGPTPEVTPSPTDSPSATPSPTASPTPSPTPAPTDSPTPTPSPTPAPYLGTGGTLWLGLKNSDDQGTYFDIFVTVERSGSTVASSLTRCVQGLTRNSNNAKQVAVAWDSSGILALGDVVTVKTRIGTKTDGTKCGGHNNAQGLRIYYDAADRASGFDTTSGPLYLHSDGTYCDVGPQTDSQGVTSRTADGSAPLAGNHRCKDSTGINFNGGNLYTTVGSWIVVALPTT